MTGKIIKRGGASFRMEHILSFRNQREFVDHYLDKLNFIKKEKERKEFLIGLYREAKEFSKAEKIQQLRDEVVEVIVGHEQPHEPVTDHFTDDVISEQIIEE